MLFIAPQLFKRSAGAPYFSLPREWLDSARVIKVYFLSPQASNFFKILFFFFFDGVLRFCTIGVATC
jgi:hypothetical protein